MDLLAPWKMCLQCLPVFSSEPSPPPPPPPPPPSKAAAVPLSHTTSELRANNGASASTQNSSENEFPENEKPSFSDASLTHDHLHQDLPLSDYAKEAGLPVYTPPETIPVAKGDAKLAEYHSNQTVSTNMVLAPHDIEFSTSGSMPLPSPITPTPIGLGYLVGQHTPSHHIHQQSQHNKGHSFFHSHGHNKAPPLHPISDSTPNEAHTQPPLLSSQSKGAGAREEAHHQDSCKRNEDTHDGGFDAPPTANVHGHHMTALPLETTHSTPAAVELASGPHAMYKDEDTNALETSQSEPIDGVGTPRVRRRDQLKDQFKGFRNQLKQGGLHLKEEGSKHLQNMMSTMNKQAQQIEESGSFLMVPRNNDS